MLRLFKCRIKECVADRALSAGFKPACWFYFYASAAQHKAVVAPVVFLRRERGGGRQEGLYSQESHTHSLCAIPQSPEMLRHIFGVFQLVSVLIRRGVSFD